MTGLKGEKCSARRTDLSYRLDLCPPRAPFTTGLPAVFRRHLPTNPNGYYGPYFYQDINGNARLDYGDIVTYYQNMEWISHNTNVGIKNYDYNFIALRLQRPDQALLGCTEMHGRREKSGKSFF
jgi:hypothetical protein